MTFCKSIFSNIKITLKTIIRTLDKDSKNELFGFKLGYRKGNKFELWFANAKSARRKSRYSWHQVLRRSTQVSKLKLFRFSPTISDWLLGTNFYKRHLARIYAKSASVDILWSGWNDIWVKSVITLKISMTLVGILNSRFSSSDWTQKRQSEIVK